MRILLAVDGSPCSEAAVAEVASRPWPSNSEFRIISAFQIPISPAPAAWAIQPEYYVEMEQALRDQAQSVVDAASAKLQQALAQSVIAAPVAGAPETQGEMVVTSDVIAGSPQSVILEEAERWKADLIVVGSHGYGTWHRLVLGSVSQAVVLHAKCSVEVVRHCNKKQEVKAA